MIGDGVDGESLREMGRYQGGKFGPLMSESVQLRHEIQGRGPRDLLRHDLGESEVRGSRVKLRPSRSFG